MSARPALPRPSEFARHWSLDPDVVYLNHGSFGACPRPVLAEQQRLRDRMESELVRFFVEELPGLTDQARAVLAGFLKCPVPDVVFMPNATTAVTTVLENVSREWREGDEVIATAHEYPACMNNLRRIASQAGAKVVPVKVPFPLKDAAEVVDAVMGAVTPRTRALLISHVTSPSALILPVERIVPELERRGIACIVDGAHATGFVRGLNLGELKPSFYTANCHKWLCTPKGSAFLYIREDRQKDFRPLVLSNNAEKPKAGRKHLHTEFDYVGTDDFTAWLAVPAGIRFMGSLLPGGWDALMARNHEVAVSARALICETLGVQPAAPESMLGPMASIFLPPHESERHARLMARPSRYHDALQDALVQKHRIQVPVWAVAGENRRLVRISAQIYNAPEQYEYLARALAEEIRAELGV